MAQDTATSGKKLELIIIMMATPHGGKKEFNQERQIPQNSRKTSFSPPETGSVINYSAGLPDEGALLYEYDYMNDDIVIEGEVYV